MPVSLTQSFIQTLAWFDLFDYPLTAAELYHWLWLAPTPPLSYFDCRQALGQSRAGGAPGY